MLACFMSAKYSCKVISFEINNKDIVPSYHSISNDSFGNNKRQLWQLRHITLKDLKKIVIVKTNIVFLVIETVKLKTRRTINKIRKENLSPKTKRYMLRKYFLSEQL